jgi:hypothetical protein
MRSNLISPNARLEAAMQRRLQASSQSRHSSSRQGYSKGQAAHGRQGNLFFQVRLPLTKEGVSDKAFNQSIRNHFYEFILSQVAFFIKLVSHKRQPTQA